MTEDEINEMLAGMKTTETAETETAAEEQKEVIPVKFEELQAVNPDVYAWITLPQFPAQCFAFCSQFRQPHCPSDDYR